MLGFDNIALIEEIERKRRRPTARQAPIGDDIDMGHLLHLIDKDVEKERNDGLRLIDATSPRKNSKKRLLNDV